MVFGHRAVLTRKNSIHIATCSQDSSRFHPRNAETCFDSSDSYQMGLSWFVPHDLSGPMCWTFSYGAMTFEHFMIIEYGRVDRLRIPE